ncbi:hypothetical protein [Thiohalorhabdus methylotrophus]|uniref:Uncharacterized protein n=1 Tax=Thiohalorhabdus methylotrophus TaxID=3242694 RepID=A0ABV4TTE2_9GAMM
MRRLLLLAALLTALPAAAEPPRSPDRGVLLQVTIPLGGQAETNPWRPRRGQALDASYVLKNLSEGWWGVGILAVGGGVLLYDHLDR